MSKFIDLTGLRFGKLTAMEYESVADARKRAWRCACDCGGIAYVAAYKLKRGIAQACACGNPATKTHGQTKTRAFKIWRGMLDRCLNVKSKDFCKYGAAGITVDSRWQNFENFLADMGQPGPGKSLDRKNGALGYSPGNCRWATITEQNRNRHNVRSITVAGVTGSILEWSAATGISTGTIHNRIRRGMSPEDAVTLPICADKSHKRNAEVA